MENPTYCGDDLARSSSDDPITKKSEAALKLLVNLDLTYHILQP